MSIASTSATTSYATTTSTSSSATTSFSADQFLSLLVEQLQNQDPLNPTDTSEIMSQMVSFANFQQVAESNTTLATISSTLNAIASALDISV